MNWMNKLKELDFKNMKKDNLLIALLAGLLLIVIALPAGSKKNTADKAEPAAEPVKEESVRQDYVKEQEERLEKALGKVSGVGEVEAMITLKASRELIVEKDTPATSSDTAETDSSGGTRSTTERITTEGTVYTQGSDGSSIPYVVKELEPEIEGIMIIAKGGDDPVTAKQITEAVMALFKVEVHKIKVMKMNETGGVKH